jgi:hypothetical protein
MSRRSADTHDANRARNGAFHAIAHRHRLVVGAWSAYYKASPECVGTVRKHMARETVHVVQAYIAGKGNRLRADPPVPCKSADAARRTAERLALTKIGVVAFSSSGDQELGDYDDEPVIIFKTGRLPQQFED